MAIRGLLFDFDGLILDTETPSFAGWQQVYRDHGQELTLEQWAPVVGTIGIDPFEHLELLVGGPVERGAVDARRNEHELTLIEVEELRPGVLDYLAEARRRDLRTAVVSSSSRRWVHGHLERLERTADFDAIVTADHDPARAKPHPTLYLEALALLGLRAEDTIAFEDSPNGVRAARSAGIFTVAVPNGVTAALGLDEADLVVPSLAELPFAGLLATAEASRRD